jgi:hypothetical protein
MRILLKCPTRGRPEQVIATLKKYVQLARRPDQIGIAISCDVDDPTMTPSGVQQRLLSTVSNFEWSALYFGGSKTKIEACNADMEKIEYPWDVVVLVSDDMVPEVSGYDELIRYAMSPDRDCILWFNDGHQEYFLNTLSIYGRVMYERLGHIYEPAYKSFYCDTELTDRCKTDLLSKTRYISKCIIRHKHFFWTNEKPDALYQQNQRFWSDDFRTYMNRKKYDFDLSILIATLEQRRPLFEKLTADIREKFARICPGLRLEILEERDSGQMSVGLKRRRLLNNTKGVYSAFIDDDDDVTDAYFEDFLACFNEKKDVMRIRGQMHDQTFTHSLENKLSGMMWVDGVFVRLPNHLNPMRSEIARMIQFEDATRGEDLKWTIQLSKSGLLQSEYSSDPSRIHYKYNLGDRVIGPEFVEYQKSHTHQDWIPTLLITAPKPQPPQQERQIRGMRLGPRGFVSRQ